MSEADLRAGYARRGDHLRRLLRTIAERDATLTSFFGEMRLLEEEVSSNSH